MDVECKTGLISDLEKEIKVEKQRDGYDIKCEHCDKVLTSKRAMRRHVKRVHLKINGDIKVEGQRGRFPRVFGDKFGQKYGDKFGDSQNLVKNMVTYWVTKLVNRHFW